MLAMMANVGTRVGRKNQQFLKYNNLEINKIDLLTLHANQMLAMLATTLKFSVKFNALRGKDIPFYLLLKINKISSQHCQQKVQSSLSHWRLETLRPATSANRYANTGLQAPTKEESCRYSQ